MLEKHSRGLYDPPFGKCRMDSDFPLLFHFLAKIRRLYDISNVLSSLKLIKKVHVTEERGRKPAFKWTGPENLSLQGQYQVFTPCYGPFDLFCICVFPVLYSHCCGKIFHIFFALFQVCRSRLLPALGRSNPARL